MLTHVINSPARIIGVAAILAAILLLIAGASRVAAHGAGEVEISFSNPQVDAPYTSLAVFASGTFCADLNVQSLNMPVVIGAGCVDDGVTIEFLLYSDDGEQATRLTQTFVVGDGVEYVVNNWAIDSAELPDYMTAYVGALDGSDPASVVPDDDDAADDDNNGEGTPGLPEVGNYGFTQPGTNPALLLGMLAVAMGLVAAARRATRPALSR